MFSIKIPFFRYVLNYHEIYHSIFIAENACKNIHSLNDNKTSGKHLRENVYPLKSHFYIAKLGYTGVYLFFLFLLQNIDCGYSLEPPRRGGSNVNTQSMF